MLRQIVCDIELYGIIVLYDILAFGTQPLTGRWIDGECAHTRGLELAVVLIFGGALISVIFTSHTIFSVVTGTILLGMGNSLFHVYGGKYVAVTSRNDIRMMGVFVSTGAVGLALGIGYSSPMLLIAFLLALLTLSVFHLYHAESNWIDRSFPIYTEVVTHPYSRSSSSVPYIYLSCLMLVVAGRAFIGESVPTLRTHLMGAPVTMVVVSLIVMLGKALGGFLSRLWGVRNVFIVTMLLSAMAFLMCARHDVFILITLLLINISMPCTLFLATKAVPGREGWAFGLLAMAILPGYLLGYLSKDDTIYQMLLDPLMATIFLESLLLLCMREYRWQVLAVSVVLNIFTNVPLNAFIIAYTVTSPLYLVILECLVVVVEFMGYSFVLHDKHKAFKYSLLCNSFSAIVGCISQFLISLLFLS